MWAQVSFVLSQSRVWQTDGRTDVYGRTAFSYTVPAHDAHLIRAHQPSLATHPWAHLLQTGSFNIPSHSWRWTKLSPVLLHSRRRHAVTTTTAFFRLWSPALTDHPSIYSRQSHIHSFWRCGMEWPADSRHCCAVTRGLQIAPHDISVFALLPWHYHLTLKLHSSSIPVWT